MKIIKVTKAIVYHVETDREELNHFTRHSANNWTVAMGESDEPVYECDDLESMFWEWMGKKAINKVFVKWFSLRQKLQAYFKA